MHANYNILRRDTSKKNCVYDLRAAEGDVQIISRTCFARLIGRKFRNTALRRQGDRFKAQRREGLASCPSLCPFLYLPARISLSLFLAHLLSFPHGTLQRSHHSKGTRGVHETHSRRAGPTRNVMRVGKSVAWSHFFFHLLLLLLFVSSPPLLLARV